MMWILNKKEIYFYKYNCIGNCKLLVFVNWSKFNLCFCVKMIKEFKKFDSEIKIYIFFVFIYNLINKISFV